MRPIEEYVAQAASEAGVPIEMIVGRDQYRSVTTPRRAAMVRAWLDGYPEGKIGEAFGKHRTTVSHALAAYRRGELEVGQ